MTKKPNNFVFFILAFIFSFMLGLKFNNTFDEEKLLDTFFKIVDAIRAFFVF